MSPDGLPFCLILVLPYTMFLFYCSRLQRSCHCRSVWWASHSSSLSWASYMASMLRLSFDWNILTYHNEEFDHCQNQNSDVNTQLAFSVEYFPLRYEGHLDAGHFTSTRGEGDFLNVCDFSEQRRNTHRHLGQLVKWLGYLQRFGAPLFVIDEGFAVRSFWGGGGVHRYALKWAILHTNQYQSSRFRTLWFCHYFDSNRPYFGCSTLAVLRARNRLPTESRTDSREIKSIAS